MNYELRRNQRHSGKSYYANDLKPGIPIVEICGTSRVLIENHFGIAAYSCDTVAVNVTEGRITVCGENLRLTRMNKGKLVICGNIHSVNMQRHK